MTREAKIQIKDIVAKFVEELKPKAIYLFGSYARGDYNETSDIRRTKRLVERIGKNNSRRRN